ncbi:carcinoembryonic antigen-related cell adhesion molecule 2-like [Clinocottus analis]|uniref:carcinoembryonic antigen-related cell adhesion molecule 2-like n=1 Tax=Clinocottus analis TaxID=304258 RepID=UPI0035C25E3C
MESPVVFALILFSTTFATVAPVQKLQASKNPLPVGSNVTLFSHEYVTSGAWMFNDSIIVWIFSENKTITNNWIDRVTLGSTSSSLTLSSVQVEDSGLYTLEAVNSFRAQVTLSVQVPISNVTLRAKASNLVEFNDTAVLTCSVLKGSSLTYVWLKGSSVVTASEGVELSDGGATLTMPMVTRYDEGPYWCNVSNGVSQESSLPVHLNISYGPSNITMKIMPMRSAYITGSNITLECSAESSPAATVQWMVDGVYLNQFGPQLQLETVAESNSGNYQCVFHNKVTSRFSSQSAMIRIVDTLYAQVEKPMYPAIEGHFYNLTCNVTGPAEDVYWMKNGERLHEDNTTVFYLDNKTVAFKPLQHNDTGHYRCMAINASWNMTSLPYGLLVNFGPKTLMIHGPDFAEMGQYAVFHCSAMSMPPSQFSWWFNGSNVANSSMFTTDKLMLNMSGNITCKAYNNVTGKSVTKSKMLTVIEAIESVMIRNNTVPINSENFTLTCDVTGPHDMIYWMKNNTHLNMTHSTAQPHMSYYIENNMLKFTPLTLYNEGTYQCVATNQAGPHKSPKYMLLVNYGPLSVNISGPESSKSDLSVSLTCSADSRPDCDYHWFLNEMSSVVQKTGPVLTFLAIKENEGNYTCKATNPVTNITMYQTKAFTVAAHASALHFSSQSGLIMMGLFACAAQLSSLH